MKNADNLKKLTEKYIELDDNNASEDELNELAHEIDHEVYNSNLIMILNKGRGETQVVALLVGEDEDDKSYFIPVYTDNDEADKASEFFLSQDGSGEFSYETITGAEIIETYTEDDDFLGVAINAPENGFAVFADTIHDCSEE